jgi:hypothetical protein
MPQAMMEKEILDITQCVMEDQVLFAQQMLFA